VRPIFFQGPDLLELPPYSVREAAPIFALMRLYNRRLAAMGRRRRVEGRFGCRNAGGRDLFPGFNFKVAHLLKIIAAGLGKWAWLEVTEGWRSWGRRRVREPLTEGAGMEVLPTTA
jgi:hypothetical protein